MTPAIKSALINIKFGHDTYQHAFKTADEVWLAHGGETSAPPTVVAAVTTSSSSSEPTSSSTSSDQVSAIQRRGARGRNFRSGRGRGRGSYRGNQNNQTNRQNNQQTTQNSNPKPIVFQRSTNSLCFSGNSKNRAGEALLFFFFTK